MMGGSIGAVIGRYREHVAANTERLRQGSSPLQHPPHLHDRPSAASRGRDASPVSPAAIARSDFAPDLHIGEDGPEIGRMRDGDASLATPSRQHGPRAPSE